MRRWLALAALIAAAALLLLTAAAMLRGLGGLLRPPAGSAPDPMFAETAAPVTRPPNLTGNDEEAPSDEGDPSERWVYSTLTPLTPDGGDLIAGDGS